jgi:hypothetical protein
VTFEELRQYVIDALGPPPSYTGRLYLDGHLIRTVTTDNPFHIPLGTLDHPLLITQVIHDVGATEFEVHCVSMPRPRFGDEA